MTQTESRTVPYEVFQREREKRIEAEKDRDHWKHEFYLQRSIRRAPVLQPMTKALLEECRHVEKWGTAKGPDGTTRANFTTIAKNLNSSGGTIARHADFLEKLDLIEIIEYQGPKDEQDRKYIHVKEEKLSALARLEDPHKIVPKQGGNRYICPRCDSTDVAVKTVKTLRCNTCHHEEVVQGKGLNEWIEQNGHKAQNQHGFGESQYIDEETGEVIDAHTSIHAQRAEDAKDVKATCFWEEQAQNVQSENHLVHHSVYTLSLIADLKALPIWCCHRGKVPYNVTSIKVRDFQKAKSNDSTTWTTYDQALAIYQDSQQWKTPFDGIGLMNNGDYVFIDLDGCRDKETGALSDQAQETIACIDSYTELSQSETGIHIIARGSIPKAIKKPEIELYPNNRFFVWTDKHLAGTPAAAEDRQEELTSLYKELAPTQETITPIASYLSHDGTGKTCSGSSEEILGKGKNDVKFMDLFHGTCIGSYYKKKDGTPDYSRADLALCQKIAYWGAGGDVSTINALFRQSGLYREKWERDAYREKTIHRAIELWQGQQREQKAS